MFQPEKIEKWEILHLGHLGVLTPPLPSGVLVRAPHIFDFRLSERLIVTIWMLDEESPDNKHTCYQQTSVVLWSYSEKYPGQVWYLWQFCSQLSEQIDWLGQTPFSSLDPRVFASTDKQWNTEFVILQPRDIEILDWCPAGPVLPHGEKLPL